MPVRPMDARLLFVAGAVWWASRDDQQLIEGVSDAAERYFPEGRIDHPGGALGRRPPDGTWPPTYPGRAFVEGAKWQEYYFTNGTMWQSDQRDCEEEAARRYPLTAEESAATAEAYAAFEAERALWEAEYLARHLVEGEP